MSAARAAAAAVAARVREAEPARAVRLEDRAARRGGLVERGEQLAEHRIAGGVDAARVPIDERRYRGLASWTSGTPSRERRAGAHRRRGRGERRFGSDRDEALGPQA